MLNRIPVLCDSMEEAEQAITAQYSALESALAGENARKRSFSKQGVQSNACDF
ncbi:MAG: hypothetical protein M3329_05740 [Pseudomonadota bacterium]|nr:hypothetical protein [Pseudomonadota bacterium]